MLFSPCLADKYEELYCFSFNPNADKAERERSWDFLDMKAEYSRMGLPNKQWHVTPINREYRVSPALHQHYVNTIIILFSCFFFLQLFFL